MFDERSGLPIRIIWKVLETRVGNGPPTLWLGTWGGGVVRLSPNFWTSFDTTNGMPSGAVTSVLLTKGDDGSEVIWAGTSDGNLARHIAVLEEAGFREVDTVWQRYMNRVLVAIR